MAKSARPRRSTTRRRRSAAEGGCWRKPLRPVPIAREESRSAQRHRLSSGMASSVRNTRGVRRRVQHLVAFRAKP
jgi:hypothetical protein